MSDEEFKTNLLDLLAAICDELRYARQSLEETEIQYKKRMAHMNAV